MDYSSLPPDYVSLAQLQERWLQKQRDKEMKAKQDEEEKKQRFQNENQSKKGLKNDVRKFGDKGKGKEVIIGGFENGEENETNKKKSRKKKVKKHRTRKKLGADGEKEMMIRSENNEEFDGEIVPQNEVKLGIKGVLSGERGGINGGLNGIEGVVSVEVMPRNGAKRGDNRGSGYRGRFNELKENEVKLDLEEKTVEGQKRYTKEWRQRRRNGRFERRGEDVSKGNVVKPELERKVDDGNLEVCSEKIGGGVNGRNNDEEDKKIESECLDDNVVAPEKKVDKEVLAVASAKNGEKGGLGNGYRRYGNRRGDNGRRFRGSAFNDSKMNGGDRRRYEMRGRSQGRWEVKQRNNSMMWVKKEDKSRVDDDAGVGSSAMFVIVEVNGGGKDRQRCWLQDVGNGRGYGCFINVCVCVWIDKYQW